MWRNLLSDEGRNIARRAENAQGEGDYVRAKELYAKAITKFGQACEISEDFNKINILRSLISYYRERIRSVEKELYNNPVIFPAAIAPVKKDTNRIGVSEMLSGTGVMEEVFGTVLGIAIEISIEGREGHAIGTAFIVGDARNVMERSRQLVLNPFGGRDKIKLTDSDIRDNVKEFAQLDGVFVISGDGVVEAAGRYITMDTSKVRVPGGLGTRHSSVAAITSVTNAIGIVVSQSGGVIRIFRNGKIAAIIKP